MVKHHFLAEVIDLEENTVGEHVSLKLDLVDGPEPARKHTHDAGQAEEDAPSLAIARLLHPVQAEVPLQIGVEQEQVHHDQGRPPPDASEPANGHRRREGHYCRDNRVAHPVLMLVDIEQGREDEYGEHHKEDVDLQWGAAVITARPTQAMWQVPTHLQEIASEPEPNPVVQEIDCEEYPNHDDRDQLNSTRQRTNELPLQHSAKHVGMVVTAHL